MRGTKRGNLWFQIYVNNIKSIYYTPINKKDKIEDRGLKQLNSYFLMHISTFYKHFKSIWLPGNIVWFYWN